jgi:hypothetical protein
MPSPRRASVSRGPPAAASRSAGSFSPRGHAECGPEARAVWWCNEGSTTEQTEIRTFPLENSTQIDGVVDGNDGMKNHITL